jgi:uncharacterized protein (DUF433 family)
MPLLLHCDPPPLQPIDDGTVRVVGTRIPLEVVVEEFKDGASPEEIVIHYPSLNLADVYTVVGFYLNHKSEVEDYLRRQEADAEAIQRKIEASQDLKGIRERLMARQAVMRGNDASASGR